MEYIGKHQRLENVKRPMSGACFHGECWYRCPKCNAAFEYWDTHFERNFRCIRKNIYQHTKDDCGQLIDMT